MYLYAIVLLCGIYLSSAATFISTESSGNETSLKQTEIPCLKFPPPPLNSRRKCSNEICRVTCMNGYTFPDGSTVSEIRCMAGAWEPTIPNCIPECNLPCFNGGVCGAPNTCLCPTAYKGSQCQYSNCDQECQNGGICVAKNFCQCRENFYGNYCEIKNECLAPPNLPMNSRRLCSTLSCIVTCNNGYKFPDGSTDAGVHCVEGAWQPTSMPDCMLN
ncbi:von Willebrand factor D and EGF domain-containing protein [Papilio machaon]|uniref:von Willebrand factor D and EGF domain-containing protein n=1 Tax=Papilio machaon TaxID=76193 RepID=UPI001E6639C3|nr:von Willebrand factor D and EGF domain-containing protein [Papilio machaon]